MAKTSRKSDRRKRLRQMLSREKDEIQRRIGEELGEKMTEDIASTLGPAPDEGDLSNLELERDVDYWLLNMLTNNLRNVEHALERLEEGTYGACDECGLEIGEKRLKAMPFARYCVDCQEDKERSMESDKGRGWMERRAKVQHRQTENDEYS
jgi:DnaK suppressor protein